MTTSTGAKIGLGLSNREKVDLKLTMIKELVRRKKESGGMRKSTCLKITSTRNTGLLHLIQSVDNLRGQHGRVIGAIPPLRSHFGIKYQRCLLLAALMPLTEVREEQLTCESQSQGKVRQLLLLFVC